MSEAEAPEIGWGLIGCGDIAGKRVAPALRDTPGSALVAVARARAALDAVLRTAKTGKLGDGKVFVTALDDAVRIRTGEHGELAL